MLILVACAPPTAEVSEALKGALEASMPIGIGWSLVTLEEEFFTSDRRDVVESTWRLGGLPAVEALVSEWAGVPHAAVDP